MDENGEENLQEEEKKQTKRGGPILMLHCQLTVNFKKKKKKNEVDTELALKSIPHPGIFGGFGRNVFFLQYGDFIKKPEVLILLSKTTT